MARIEAPRLGLGTLSVPGIIRAQLELQGYQIAQDNDPVWVGLVDLSECRPDQVADALAASDSKYQIALVAPEQTALASEAMRHGAQDYLLLPLDADHLVSQLARLMQLEQDQADMVACSPRSRQLLMLAHRAAQTDASVLLTGESGTGKEQLARFIHRYSPRADGPFLAVNCAAIPEAMLESLLFGHVKGAFTGAHADKPGKFEAASGGTLLLDEIGELPLLLQAKLLRVLQEREVERLGAHHGIALDIRIIAATNQDLRQAVAEGRFREDLFYRLDVLPLKTVPLRERREDILPLAEHFLTQYGEGSRCHFSDAARQVLMGHDWPGNVRELENTVQRALVMRRGSALQVAELGLPASVQAMPAPVEAESGLKASKRQAEFQYIVDVLRRFDGHRSRSAEALGMTTRALRYKLAQMREQGMDIDRLLQPSDAA
ncbi:two component, sigma54 specific, transcriptional regulator, Fis family [Ferrimonas balearica DSM 9799]|uniref:Two component, sigma54 specific, transcriptional regulator, Fis family n=1 Tax=Ferrimonas balearica (strain DSM 9799 / CCM 4581 / KCTC 23876 / PAT) TaxID=550540 RepID=E1SLG6_FERBD|nr:two component, sigma54 specific, transcriptional regulator, Fis family [Ferrimonas balearica DSM 9799]